MSIIIYLYSRQIVCLIILTCFRLLTLATCSFVGFAQLNDALVALLHYFVNARIQKFRPGACRAMTRLHYIVCAMKYIIEEFTPNLARDSLTQHLKGRRQAGQVFFQSYTSP